MNKQRITIAEFKAMVKEEQNEQFDEVPFAQKTIAGKFLFLVCYPLDFIAFITIPPSEYDKLDRPWIGIFSFTSFLAMLILNGCKSPHVTPL